MKQVLFSFDTTGSMYPALREARTKISESVSTLFRRIPDLEIAIAAHGDYNDRYHPDDVVFLDFTRDETAIVRFVNQVGSTNGFGNGGECYEAMLHGARNLSWKAGDAKVVVMLGDEPAHNWYSHRIARFDWENELGLLLEAGITVYPVQALRSYYTDGWHGSKGRYDANAWYERVADLSGGYLLQLDQFHNVVPLIEAVAYRQAGNDMLRAYEEELRDEGLYRGREIDRIFDTLLERTVSRTYTTDKIYANQDLEPVTPGRFQVLSVIRDTPINQFVDQFADADFRLGAGFYQLTKTVTVQPYKEVILRHKETGDFFTGDAARKLVGLQSQKPRGTGVNERLRPVYLKDFDVFIQSTAPNRKLLGGTMFLYEVQDDANYA